MPALSPEVVSAVVSGGALTGPGWVVEGVDRPPRLFVAGQDSEFWPASHTAACVVLAPVGDPIVLGDDGHAANIEQPKAFNEALLGFLRTG